MVGTGRVGNLLWSWIENYVHNTDWFSKKHNVDL